MDENNIGEWLKDHLKIHVSANGNLIDVELYYIDNEGNIIYIDSDEANVEVRN